MQFNPAAFIDNLRYMGLGMLGIFVVIGLIVGITYLLNLLIPARNNTDGAGDEDSGQ